MQITIADKASTGLGSLELAGNKLIRQNLKDANLTSVIESSFKNGVNILVEEYDATQSRFLMFDRIVEPDDPDFDLALIKFLEAHGYNVMVEDIEVDSKILQL